MKVLIIGGNHFFGKRLAKLLVKQNHHVTLLNRGNLSDDLEDNIQRIVCDRNDTAKMSKLLDGKYFDVVFDQACFDFNEAKSACEIFKGKVGKYVFTSSQSVYDAGSALKESDFDPKTHEFESLTTKEEDYAEAKRQAEVGFTKFANFPACFVRFPIVIGEDDRTGRIQFHVNAIKEGREVFFYNLEASISFIYAADAALALSKLGESDFEGPINVASSQSIKIGDFVRSLETCLGKEILFASERDKKNMSPYGIREDWYMNCDKLNSLGITLEEISSWLPRIIPLL